MTGLLVPCPEKYEELVLECNELQRRLQEAEAAAESAAESKSIFLANISHEIRTPLNGMIVVSQLMLRTNLTPEQRELVSTIEESGLCLLSILGSVLDFSCLGRADVQLQATPLLIRDVIEGSLESAGPDAASRAVHLSYRLAPALASRQVIADPIRLRQALSALVNNAVKFNVYGGEVEINASVDSVGSTLTISVQDSGIGMEPAVAASVFQMFKQGEEGFNRRHGGAGLGLSIASGLVEAMGGDISLQSSPGHGSTFIVTLPLVWAPAAHERPSHARVDVPAPTRNDNQHTETGVEIRKENIRMEDMAEIVPAKGEISSGISATGFYWPGTPVASRAPSLRYPTTTSIGVSSTCGLGSTATMSASLSGAEMSTHSRRSSNSSAVDVPLPPPPSQLQASPSHRPTPAATADYRESSLFAPSSIASVATATLSAPGSPVSFDNAVASLHCCITESDVATPAAPSPLAGRCVLVDVDHVPTAMQIADSCSLIGLKVIHGQCGDATGRLGGGGRQTKPVLENEIESDGDGEGALAVPDVCVTSPAKVLNALRGGWRGHPIVAVGLKKDLPLAVQPLVTVLVPPLKHSRLVSTLCQAVAPRDVAMGAPLHADAALQPCSPAS